jgi:hypothetical protein
MFTVYTIHAKLKLIQRALQIVITEIFYTKQTGLTTTIFHLRSFYILYIFLPIMIPIE